MIASEMKSETANAKNSSRVLIQFEMRLMAEVHHAEKFPLQANINENKNPSVQTPTMHIMPRYIMLWRFPMLLLSTTKILR